MLQGVWRPSWGTFLLWALTVLNVVVVVVAASNATASGDEVTSFWEADIFHLPPDGRWCIFCCDMNRNVDGWIDSKYKKSDAESLW